MFIGVDHGTRAIRFASSGGGFYELSRVEAGRLSSERILEQVRENLGLHPKEVKLVALSYSMGDDLTRIVRMKDAVNRGLIQLDGAGAHVGGGTRVYEAIERSGWPAILLPGIHRSSATVDPRLKVFSHGMSPEKVGLAYGIFRQGVQSFLVCDASSNTVTFGVIQGKIVGAIDAPIFAPGLLQGPLDVAAIRKVDSGEMTANQAFNLGGILRKMGKERLEDCSDDTRAFVLEVLALFAAMEIGALMVLMRDLGQPHPDLFLAGSPALLLERRVAELLDRKVRTLGKYAAAQGCAWIAEDVYHGADQILGLQVDQRARIQARYSP
jgi:putative methanogenesis marker protein 12